MQWTDPGIDLDDRWDLGADRTPLSPSLLRSGVIRVAIAEGQALGLVRHGHGSRALSQSGEGPTFTPSKTRAVKRRQMSGSAISTAAWSSAESYQRTRSPSCRSW